MGVEPIWIAKVSDYLVPCTVGIFIWAIKVANFLQNSSQVCFGILEKQKQGDKTKGLDDLDSLYLTVITISFRCTLKPEIKAITSIIGAMIFAK